MLAPAPTENAPCGVGLLGSGPGPVYWPGTKNRVTFTTVPLETRSSAPSPVIPAVYPVTFPVPGSTCATGLAPKMMSRSVPLGTAPTAWMTLPASTTTPRPLPPSETSSSSGPVNLCALSVRISRLSAVAVIFSTPLTTAAVPPISTEDAPRPLIWSASSTR